MSRRTHSLTASEETGGGGGEMTEKNVSNLFGHGLQQPLYSHCHIRYTDAASSCVHAQVCLRCDLRV